MIGALAGIAGGGLGGGGPIGQGGGSSATSGPISTGPISTGAKNLGGEGARSGISIMPGMNVGGEVVNAPFPSVASLFTPGNLVMIGAVVIVGILGLVAVRN